jgi:hypothetical protein
LKLSVQELARLRVGSTLKLDQAELVSGAGSGHAFASVRLSAAVDGTITARVEDPSVTPLEALLHGVSAGAQPAGPGRASTVARANYAVFRPGSAPKEAGAHAQARAELDALVAGVARLIARAPEIFEDPEVRAAGRLDQLGGWVDALHALARGEPAKVGRSRAYANFGAWREAFVAEWCDGALAAASVMLRRVREGRGLPRDGETAVNLLGLLADVLPGVFREDAVQLVICRPLDTPFDLATMRAVGKQAMEGFEGRVVGQLRVGVIQNSICVRPADVVVA